MAQLALTIAGGWKFGTIGALLGGIIGKHLDQQVLFPTREKQYEGPQLDAINVQTAAYGILIPRVWGAFKFAGNIIWASEPEYDEDRESLSISFAVGVCQGPVASIPKIWFNDVPIQNYILGGLAKPYLSDWRGPGTSREPIYKAMRIYLGTNDQTVDPEIYKIENANGKPVPASRGLAYVVFEDVAIKYTDNAIPNVTFLVATEFEETATYTEIPILAERPPGTIRTLSGYEMGIQECYDTYTWAPGGVPSSVARIYGTEPTDEAAYVHSGDYSLMFSAWKTGYAYARHTVPLSCYAESGEPTSMGGRVQWDTVPVHPMWISVWCRFPSIPTPTRLDPEQEESATYDVYLLRAQHLHNSSVATVLGLKLVVEVNYFGEVRNYLSVFPEQGGGSTEIIGTLNRWRLLQVKIGTYDAERNEVSYQVYLDQDLVISGTFTPGDQWQRYANLVRLECGHAGRAYAEYPDDTEYYQAHFDDLVVSAEHVLNYPSQDGEDGSGVPDDYGIVRLRPVAAGSHQGWSGGYPAIDESPADESDYIETIANGDAKSTFTLSPVPSWISRVTAVNVAAACYGTWNQSFQLAIIDGATEEETYPVKLRDIADRHDQVQKIYETDLSGAPWRRESIEALEIGVGWLSDPGGSQKCTQLSACLLYGAYGEEGVGPGDNLVVHADEIHISIEQGGLWNRYNCESETIVAVNEHKIGDEAEIPISGCDFDIDEKNVVYTCKWTGSSDENEATVVRLTGTSYREIEDTVWTVDAPSRVRVCRNTEHPWLGIICEDGNKLFLLARGTLDWAPWDYLSYEAPDGYAFVALTVDDDTGRFWALCNGTDTEHLGDSLVWTVLPIYGAEATPLTDEITSEVEGDGEVILFDSDSGEIVVGVLETSEAQDGHVEFYSVSISDSLTLTHEGTATGEVIGPYPKSAWRRGPVNGHLWFAYEENVVCRLNMAVRDVDETHEVEGEESGDATPSWLGGNVYEPNGHSIITGCDLETADYCRVWLNRGESQEVTLGDIVEDICNQAELESTELDVTALTQTVHGYMQDNRMRARALIQPLMDAFFFDMVESDGKLKFPLRGGAPVVAIPEAHLAAHYAGEERPQELVSTRQQEIELPRVLEVIYVAYENNYEQGVQRSQRQATESQEIVAVDCPIALSDDEARQIAEKRHAYAWVQRVAHKCFVPRQYAYLDPAEVVTVTEGGVTHTVRIEKIAYRGGVIEIEATNEKVSTYSSDASGIGSSAKDQDEGTNPGATLLQMIDCPLLRSSDNEPGVYFAATGYLDTWRGAEIYLSRDGGDSWTRWGQTSRVATIGVATTALADVSDPWVWDRGGSVNVRFAKSDDSVGSDTRLNVLNGANTAILGDEIMRWQDVTEESDGSLTLTTLLRGLNGTEWATGTHEVGDRFVLLDDGDYSFHGYLVADDGVELRFKAVSVGALTDAGEEQDFTCEIRNLMPWAPVHIEGTRDGSNNLTVTCDRRSRFHVRWQDAVEAPLGEESEAYEVDILDASTVVRTIETTTTSISYTAAEQTTDGLTPGHPVSLIWYPMSATIGRGFGAAATV